MSFVAREMTSPVEQVAASFGADFFEVETGEINVVTRMQDLERHDICAAVGVEGPNGGTVFSGTTCRDGTLVGAGALLAAADHELRAIVCETLGRGRQMRPDLAGFIELLPPQRSFMEKHPAPDGLECHGGRARSRVPGPLRVRAGVELATLRHRLLVYASGVHRTSRGRRFRMEGAAVPSGR